MERKPAKSFQDLIVWQKAHLFVLETYRETGMYPKTEMFGLSAQFRRAAVSIAANIAEGFKKKERPTSSGFIISRRDRLKNAGIIYYCPGIFRIAARKRRSLCSRK